MYTSSFADKPSILLAFTIINNLLTTASYMIVPDIPIIERASAQVPPTPLLWGRVERGRER